MGREGGEREVKGEREEKEEGERGARENLDTVTRH